MEKSFRQSMRWVHTYSGLIVGWLLFVIFVTGTSSYYRNEITLWMQPELHKSFENEKTLDVSIKKALELSKTSSNVSVTLPNSRSNTIKITQRNANAQGGGHSHGPTGHTHGPNGAHIHGPNGEEIPLSSLDQKNGQKKATKNTSKTNPQNNKRQERPQPKHYDASTGKELKARTTAGGNFLYRFHFELYNIPRNIARWIIGIATMFMLVAIISGVIIHKRIFKDIFTFRPQKGPRGWMDAHILPAVAALPFFIMITYSGLLLFTNTLMPWALKVHFGDNPRAFKQQMMKVENQSSKVKNTSKKISINSEHNKNLERIININAFKSINKYKNTKGAYRLLSANANRQITIFKNKNSSSIKKKKQNNFSINERQIKKVLKKASELWPNNIGVFSIIKDISNKSYKIQVYPKDQTSIYSFKRNKESATFDAKSAKILSHSVPPVSTSVIRNTYLGLFSLHMAQFADSTLRFIFFICGLSGIVLAGTGLILWTEKRKKKNEVKKSFGFWLVEKLNLGTIMGIFIAIAVYFIANRFIPIDEPTRKTLEINVFFITWALVYIYAFIRNTKKAWKEQVIFAAILFILLPIINAFTTFDSVSQIFNRDIILINFDIFFIFMSLVFILITFILIKKSNKGAVK